MPENRMNREEFFVKLAPLDAEQRGKILWNLYWRGTAAVRERIEGELDPPERERRKRAAATPPDPASVLEEVSTRNALSGWRSIRHSRALMLIFCGRGPRGSAGISMRRAP